jgi:hypothetical protein
MIIYRSAAALCLLLEVVEHGYGHAAGLPIGGGPLAQLGLVFSLAFIMTEGQETMSSLNHWFGRKLRSLRQKLRALKGQ